MMRQSKAHSWAGSCLRKKAMTLDRAEKLVKNVKMSGGFLRSYLCPFCLRYHVTKWPEKSHNGSTSPSERAHAPDNRKVGHNE